MDHLADRLRSERERQRRSLRELSAETKIREPFLAALERGEYHVLPSVYVRSFIKTYATALRIPAAEIASLIDEVLEQDDDRDRSLLRRPELRQEPKQAPVAKPSQVMSEQPQQERTGVSRRPLDIKLGSSFMDVLRGFPIWAWIAVLGVLVVAVVMWMAKDDDDRGGAMTAADSAALVVDVDATDAMETDSMVLRAEVQDTAWINITADNKNSYQVLILPGTEHKWSAMQQFVLSMSNAGGVVFYRDEVKLDPFGRKGESVRSITVTRREVRSPASAWQPVQQPTQQPAATPPPKSAPAKAVAKPASTTRARRAVEGPAITPAPMKPAVPNKR